jgi:hypothetical protein
VAKYVRTELIDDLDASTDGVESHRFACDGVEYEIDLTEPNMDRLRAALAPFIAAGRRLPSTVVRRRPGQRPPSTSDAPAIRAWWAANAVRLRLPAHRTHGMIPAQVRQAYRDARD